MLFLFELCSLLHSHVWVKTVAPLETWHLYTGAAGAAGTDLCPVCVCSDLSLRTDLTNNLNVFGAKVFIFLYICFAQVAYRIALY